MESCHQQSLPMLMSACQIDTIVSKYVVEWLSTLFTLLCKVLELKLETQLCVSA